MLVLERNKASKKHELCHEETILEHKGMTRSKSKIVCVELIRKERTER